ncbi:MAG: ABC transporter ATP-binding protein [Verrucomicrobiales bacterium]|nr:ABC transporter ATP-binding protein [Verrucomicrobiales bacterium]
MRLKTLIRIVQLGIKSLLLHKMRSGLTMLGIIFGVCSVIAMLAIGEGASYEAQEAIKKLGSSNIIIRSVKPPQEKSMSSAKRDYVNDYGLTYQDANSIRATIKNVDTVLPMRIIREEVRFNSIMFPVQVIGTHPIYPDMTGLEVVRGRFLTYTDERSRNNICVLTASLAEHLFPYENPVEQEVRMGADYFKVVGIVRETSIEKQRPQAGESEGATVDHNVYVPLSSAKARFGETIINRSAGSYQAEKVELHQITVRFTSTDAVQTAVPQIKTLLEKFHDTADYEVIVPIELLRQAEQTKRIFNIVLGSIAAISLIVGGIGIMNIMLATVTERTREIGIRRALGAKKHDIVTQFLVETVVLSIGGGLIGVVFGVVIPVIVSHLADMKTIVTPISVIIAFGISGAVGVVFGIYPASQAADLDPIEALRHE